jgi:hypothetical protein
MEQRGFVQEGEEAEGTLARRSAKDGPLRPKDCEKYMRKRVAEALPTIAESFIKKANEASVPHTKVLLALSGLEGRRTPKAKRHKGQTIAGRLLEQFGSDPKL